MPGMRGLGMLLESVELVQPVARREPDQDEVPDLANEITGGTTSVWAVDVTACDCQKIFGLDASDIADVSRRAPDFPGSQRGLGQIVTQAGLGENVETESLFVRAQGFHEHPWGDIDVTHPSAQRLTHRLGDL